MPMLFDPRFIGTPTGLTPEEDEQERMLRTLGLTPGGVDRSLFAPGELDQLMPRAAARSDLADRNIANMQARIPSLYDPLGATEQDLSFLNTTGRAPVSVPGLDRNGQPQRFSPAQLQQMQSGGMGGGPSLGPGGPRSLDDLNSSYASRFPEGKNYGAFTAIIGPDGKLQVHPNDRVVNPVEPRRLNSLAATDATRKASENRNTRLMARQNQRSQFQDKLAEQRKSMGTSEGTSPLAGLLNPQSLAMMPERDRAQYVASIASLIENGRQKSFDRQNELEIIKQQAAFTGDLEKAKQAAAAQEAEANRSQQLAIAKMELEQRLAEAKAEQERHLAEIGIQKDNLGINQKRLDNEIAESQYQRTPQARQEGLVARGVEPSQARDIVGGAASIGTPSSIAADNAKQLQQEQEAAQQLKLNPQAREATIRDLIALPPEQLTPDVIRQNGVTSRDLFNYIAGNLDPRSPEWQNATRVLAVLDPAAKADLDRQVQLHVPPPGFDAGPIYRGIASLFN